MYLPVSAACQLVPQAAMLMLVALASSLSLNFISPRNTLPESSETLPSVVSVTARGCSQISLSMKCL